LKPLFDNIHRYISLAIIFCLLKSGASRTAALTDHYDLQAPLLDETALEITKISAIKLCSWSEVRRIDGQSD
jgi:hypothetical protein